MDDLNMGIQEHFLTGRTRNIDWPKRSPSARFLLEAPETKVVEHLTRFPES